MTVCSLLSPTKIRLSRCHRRPRSTPGDNAVWRERQGAQSRYCITLVIQVTARRLCLSCQTDVIAIETDDRLWQKTEFHKPSLGSGLGLKPV